MLYCTATVKILSCSLGEENWRTKLISLFDRRRRYGGEASQCATVQACGQLCVPERERRGEKGLEKGQEKLDVFCLHNTGKKLHGRLPSRLD